MKQTAKCAAWLFALAITSPLARAQDADEVTPQVQQLYAEAHSAQAAGDTQAAIAKYRAMLRLAPHLAAAYNNLGMLYFNQHDYPQAAATLAHGLALNPQMTGAEAMLGMSYLEMGEPAKAAPVLEGAVRSGSADPQVQVALARAELGEGDPDRAVSVLQTYTQQHPEDAQVWYLLGKTYLQLSEAALGKVQQVAPDSVYAHEIAGEVDASMHNYPGALVEYQKAASAAPEQPGVHLRMGDAYRQMSQWDEAVKQFQAELAVDPHSCEASWKLGDSILESHGDAMEALHAEDTAVAECPGLGPAHADRARALIALHRPDEALADLQAALKTAPDEPSVHFLLAQAYRAQGHRDRALAEMQTYARLKQEESATDVKQVQAVEQVQH